MVSFAASATALAAANAAAFSRGVADDAGRTEDTVDSESLSAEAAAVASTEAAPATSNAAVADTTRSGVVGAGRDGGNDAGIVDAGRDADCDVVDTGWTIPEDVVVDV